MDDQLHEANDALDKLLTEADHLDRVAGQDGVTVGNVALVLSVAKRVRRASNIAVRASARLRDQLQAQEATSE